MSEYTKGPWVFDPETAAPTIWEGMSPSGNGKPGRLVATVWGDDAFTEANARLVAAAPDLLNALKAILDYRDEMYADAENPPQGEDLRYFTEKRHELWTRGRKAVSAATSSPVVKTGGQE